MEQQVYKNQPSHPNTITQGVNNSSQALCLEQDLQVVDNCQIGLQNITVICASFR